MDKDRNVMDKDRPAKDLRQVEATVTVSNKKAL